MTYEHERLGAREAGSRETENLDSGAASGPSSEDGSSSGEAVALRPRREMVEYKTWSSMKQRVLNPKANNYHNYGGRGIRVCQRWLDSFRNFYEDMGPRPSSKHSLDRIDNEGDYEPSNCRWATLLEQHQNTRVNVKIDGKCIAEISRDTGLSVGCLNNRVDRGVDAFAPVHFYRRGERCYKAKLTNEQALEIRRVLFESSGRRGTSAALAKAYGVSQSTVSLIGKGKTWNI